MQTILKGIDVLLREEFWNITKQLTKTTEDFRTGEHKVEEPSTRS